MMCAILACFSLISLFADSAVQEPDRTVLYDTKDGVELYMDIYEPSVLPAQDKPTLIHIFGGGFMDGSRHQEWLRPWFRQMNSLGYRMISIDYRLGLKGVGEVSTTQFAFLLAKSINMAVQDLYSATRYIIDHSEELGIDANNLVLTGSSAGAITAQQAEWNICQQSNLAKVLPEGFNYRGVMAFAGAVLATGQLEYPMTPCPMLIFHGTEDELVPYEQIDSPFASFYGACPVKAAAQQAGGTVRIYRFPGNNHAVAGYMPYMVEKEVDFIENAVIRGSKESLDAQIEDPSLPTYKTDPSNSLYDIRPDTELSLPEESRWSILPDSNGIIWDASTGLPYEDHLEMSGEKVSCVLRWGVSEHGSFHSEKSLVFPLLRSWICMPLIAGLKSRAQGTAEALL